MRVPWFFILAGAIAVIVGSLAACGDDEEGGGGEATTAAAEGDEAEIVATLQSLADAWNEKDVWLSGSGYGRIHRADK